MKAELVLDVKATLGEGPHWDDRQKLLYWVDIEEKRVCAYNPKTNQNKVYQFEQLVGAVIPGKEGSLILALQHGIHRYDIESNQLTKLVDPEENKPDNRFNDAKCDPSGRLWAGTMSLIGEKESGALYRLGPNGHIHKIVSPVSISNGLAWSPDKKYMYYIDTPTNNVAVYEYDDETGDIQFEKIAVQIPADMGGPDGMTIDNEGMIWVAHWGGAKVTCWNPHTGTLLGQVDVPAKNVTSCAFGGENLDELYITTARAGMSESDLAKYPQSGGLFKVKTEHQGMRANNFN